MAEIDKLISEAEEYIASASINSSKALEKAGLNFEFCGGVLSLSPKMCASIYRDMLREMLEKQSPMSQKYCLTAIIIPVKDCEGNISLSLQLGIVWPNGPKHK